MTPEQVRVAALSQAASDAKHRDYPNNSMGFSGSGAPDAATIVARAKVYLKFLTDSDQPKTRKRRTG